MITPLMLVLSCIKEDFGYDNPVDIMYLSRSDRNLLQSEIARLREIVFDEENILMTEDRNGNAVCDTVQVRNGAIVEILPETAILLTRIRECMDVYSAESKVQVGEDDVLDTDAVVLRLEGNPKYVYIYTYEVMENPSLNYDAKISRLSELYSVIVGHTTVSSGESEKQSLSMKRRELHSSFNFWQRLIMHDYMTQNAAVIQPMDEARLARVKEELHSLGLYGFVNPLQMYSDFAGARVNRKSVVNIDSEVLDFLYKVIRSGGATA